MAEDAFDPDEKHALVDEPRLRQKVERLEADLSETHSRQIELVQRLADYENSSSVRLARRLSQVASVLAPRGSTRRSIAGEAARARRSRLNRVRSASGIRRTGHDEAQHEYGDWLLTRIPTPHDLDLQRRESAHWSYRPLVSVCMPVYNPDPAACSAAIASVQAQSYENWELCIVDDSSTQASAAAVLEATPEEDPRLKVVRSGNRGGISRADESGPPTRCW